MGGEEGEGETDCLSKVIQSPAVQEKRENMRESSDSEVVAQAVQQRLKIHR